MKKYLEYINPEEFKLIQTLASDIVPRPSPVVNKNKTTRNEICSCGSGKKFKKCCINKSE
jgi:uncharacterized protein YecA (UPF0149 family)